MDCKQLHAKLKASGIAGIGDLDESTHDPFVVVEREHLVDALTFLRDDPDCALEMLHLVTAVEREEAMEVVYHVCSLARRHALTLKVVVPRPEGVDAASWIPEVPSVCGVHAAADWHEREQWDLLGVRFTGHPDLRRILLPEGWKGHPLRKDYVYPTEHDEIPLELDAVPLYERGPDWTPPADREPRPAGTPLRQPPAPMSSRPHAGGHAPEPGAAPSAPPPPARKAGAGEKPAGKDSGGDGGGDDMAARIAAIKAKMGKKKEGDS